MDRRIPLVRKRRGNSGTQEGKKKGISRRKVEMKKKKKNGGVRKQLEK